MEFFEDLLCWNQTQPKSSINLSAMGDSIDCNYFMPVVNLIKNSIITSPNPPFRASSHEFFSFGGVWVLH